MIQFPELPEFLRAEVSRACPLSAEAAAAVATRMAAAGHRKATRRSKKRERYDLPRNMDAASLALLRAIEKEKRDKQAERFRLLRERRK